MNCFLFVPAPSLTSPGHFRFFYRRRRGSRHWRPIGKEISFVHFIIRTFLFFHSFLLLKTEIKAIHLRSHLSDKRRRLVSYQQSTDLSVFTSPSKQTIKTCLEMPLITSDADKRRFSADICYPRAPLLIDHVMSCRRPQLANGERASPCDVIRLGSGRAGHFVPSLFSSHFAFQSHMARAIKHLMSYFGQMSSAICYLMSWPRHVTRTPGPFAMRGKLLTSTFSFPGNEKPLSRSANGRLKCGAAERGFGEIRGDQRCHI